jgi:hypothetical protein
LNGIWRYRIRPRREGAVSYQLERFKSNGCIPDFLFVAVILTYFVPFQIIIFIWVTYVLRPPRFRFDLPAFYLSFILDSWTAKDYKLIAKYFIEVVKVHVI